jgi:hypothetical protein
LAAIVLALGFVNALIGAFTFRPRIPDWLGWLLASWTAALVLLTIVVHILASQKQRRDRAHNEAAHSEATLRSAHGESTSFTAIPMMDHKEQGKKPQSDTQRTGAIRKNQVAKMARTQNEAEGVSESLLPTSISAVASPPIRPTPLRTNEPQANAQKGRKEGTSSPAKPPTSSQGVMELKVESVETLNDHVLSAKARDARNISTSLPTASLLQVKKAKESDTQNRLPKSSSTPLDVTPSSQKITKPVIDQAQMRALSADSPSSKIAKTPVVSIQTVQTVISSKGMTDIQVPQRHEGEKSKAPSKPLPTILAPPTATSPILGAKLGALLISDPSTGHSKPLALALKDPVFEMSDKGEPGLPKSGLLPRRGAPALQGSNTPPPTTAIGVDAAPRQGSEPFAVNITRMGFVDKPTETEPKTAILRGRRQSTPTAPAPATMALSKATGPGPSIQATPGMSKGTRNAKSADKLNDRLAVGEQTPSGTSGGTLTKGARNAQSADKLTLGRRPPISGPASDGRQIAWIDAAAAPRPGARAGAIKSAASLEKDSLPHPREVIALMNARAGEGGLDSKIRNTGGIAVPNGRERMEGSRSAEWAGSRVPKTEMNMKAARSADLKDTSRKT